MKNIIIFNQEALINFLKLGVGSGHGYGYGSGSGHGHGYGSGYGSGYGEYKDFLDKYGQGQF